MSQNENKATQTEKQKIDQTLDGLLNAVQSLPQISQQYLPSQTQCNLQQIIQRLDQIDLEISQITKDLPKAPQEESQDPNQITQPLLWRQLAQLNDERNKLLRELDQLEQQQRLQANKYIQQAPLNGSIDINTPQGQQILEMMQAQDPRINVVPVPDSNVSQITFNDEPIYELNNQQPIKKVRTTIEKKKDDNAGEYILAGFIILMTILTCILAVVGLNQKVKEHKQTKKEAEKQKEREHKEEKPQTTEQKDSGQVEVKEKACVATTTQEKTIDGKVVGNCDAKQTDTKGVELTGDAKQALNTVANPEDRYTITNANGTQQTGYSITGSSDGQIHWRDANGKLYHADKNTITITNKNGQTLSDGAENIICDLTWQQKGNSNVVDWYYNSNTKIEHNPTTGNILDITYQNNNSVWGTAGVTQSQIGVQDALGALPLSTLQRASQQTNIRNTFLAPFSVANNTLQTNALSTTYKYDNNTCIGTYDNADGFVSNIGENHNLRKAIETENKTLVEDGKLQYTDAHGDTQTLNDNVFAYDVENGKLTVKYNYNKDSDTYDTSIYNLADYRNLNIASDNAGSTITNAQLNIADNVRTRLDPNSGKTYVYADGLKATATGQYGDKNYDTTFKLGNVETSLANLTADDIRSNETLTNMYNNNDQLYNYIRLNENYDNSKFTNNAINNYNQLNNLTSLNSGIGYNS